MQPEGNAQNENVAPATAPVMAPEPAKKDNPFENTPKKSNGMLYGLILCAILAVGGIGFGVWAMMDGNQQKEQLNSQIDALRSQNNELQDKLSEIDEDIIIDVNTNSSDVDTADYIYVGEWGLKIKIPEHLEWVGYQYITDDNCDRISVTGAVEKDGQTPDFVRTLTNYEAQFQGMVTRCTKDSGEPNYGTSISLGDDYYYIFDVKQSALSENQTEWDRESTDLIKEMLTNSENYSKI